MPMLHVGLPNGEEIEANFAAVYSTAQELYELGIDVGEHKAPLSRSDAAFHKFGQAMGVFARQLAEEVWDRAMSQELPYKCLKCGVRYRTMSELITHATDKYRPLYGDKFVPMRPDCLKAMELGMRSLSEASEAIPKALE